MQFRERNTLMPTGFRRKKHSVCVNLHYSTLPDAIEAHLCTNGPFATRAFWRQENILTAIENAPVVDEME